MLIVKTLDTIKNWFEENVCNKVELKLPPEDGRADCEDYFYRLGHPACFANSIPSADELPQGKYNTPCALIEFVSGSDNVAGKLGTMDIQVFFSVWNTGTHPFDFFGKLREEKKGTFQKDDSGWIDVLNFVDVARLALKKATVFNSEKTDETFIYMDKGEPITYGYYTDGNSPLPHPYWGAWVKFRINDKIPGDTGGGDYIKG